MEVLEIFIPISMFLLIFGIVKQVSDNRLRHKIVEKELVNSDLKGLFTQSPYPALKWALVLIGAGIAVVISVFIDIPQRELLMIALMLIFGGLGFLVYFIIVRKIENKNNHSSS